jgi:hypothetical protein
MSINSSDHTKTSKPDESNVQYLQSQTASQTAINLDPKLISGWLDRNPQFLAEYLRKQQSQRRNHIINDETSQLLSNFYANLRLQTNNFSTSLHGTSGMHAFSTAQSTQLATQFLGDNDQFLTDSRKKFKELTLYEKMYALVKALYQSLDLKTTCRKILKTVSLLLDADRYIYKKIWKFCNFGFLSKLFSQHLETFLVRKSCERVQNSEAILKKTYS